MEFVINSKFGKDVIHNTKFEAQRAGLNIEGANTQGETVWLNQNQKETLFAILKDVKLGIQYALEKPFTVWKEKYGYDNNGNRTTKTTAFGTLEYNYDSENRLSSVGKITYTYDANGNLLREDDQNNVKKEYTYTGFDRIKTSQVSFGKTSGAITNTYRYDGLQRHVLQEDKSKKTLRSVYAQTYFRVLNEWEVNRDGSAITNRRIGSRQYFYAAGELYSIKEYRLANSDIEYFYKDRQASIKAAASGDGYIRQRIDYSVFGEPLGKWSLSVGYAEKPYDFNTRLSNYGYRDYSPHTGRFTTVDPICDGSNWYAYCNNDPVNWIDEWGLSAGDGQAKSGGGEQKLYSMYSIIDSTIPKIVEQGPISKNWYIDSINQRKNDLLRFADDVGLQRLTSDIQALSVSKPQEWHKLQTKILHTGNNAEIIRDEFIKDLFLDFAKTGFEYILFANATIKQPAPISKARYIQSSYMNAAGKGEVLRSIVQGTLRRHSIFEMLKQQVNQAH